MNDSPDTLEGAARLAAPLASPDEDVGWYLYGITRAEPGTLDDIRGLGQADTIQPVDVVSSGDLLAVVRRVPLGDFSPEALSIRAEDPAWIEATAREHNATIAAVHKKHTILPAKFGSVYASVADLQAALQAEQDALLARLDRLTGCDEWGVRLFGDVATIRQRADAEQESVQRLHEDIASASPGRAYFLQRRLEEELVHAVDNLLDELAERAYAQFARHAQEGQESRRINGSQIAQQGTSAEILRTAFLVARESADAFIEDVRSFAESELGVWCDYSGPWPPYSFAAQMEPTE